MSTQAISSQMNLGDDAAAAKTWVLGELGPQLARASYKITGTSAWSVEFTKRSLPGWALLLGIVTLPIGLLFLVFVRRADVLIVDLYEQDGTVLATVTGMGPKMVREFFEKLNREGVAMRATAAPPAPTIVAPEEKR